ncbi:MAG: hypothetical protein K6A38_04140 [Lachnospiraceae bacterium]|nr:hypothetical protein [Lachnospiraceae bacterium]
MHFYIYEDKILEKAQEIGVGNEAKVWFHVNGVNDWNGYDCSIVALDEPGSDFPGGGSGSGSDEDDWDDIGSTSFILHRCVL